MPRTLTFDKDKKFYLFEKTGTAGLIDARPRPLLWTGVVSCGFVKDEVVPEAGDILDRTTISVAQAKSLDAELSKIGLGRVGCEIVRIT